LRLHVFSFSFFWFVSGLEDLFASTRSKGESPAGFQEIGESFEGLSEAWSADAFQPIPVGLKSAYS
jgi:hypothetical protein